jgi:hypothetical protein
MDIYDTKVVIPEVPFRNRTHSGWSGLVNNIAKPRSNPYFLLWRRSPIWTKTPVKQFNAASGWAQQVGVSQFIGRNQPRVNVQRSKMVPYSGNMPRIVGVQGDDNDGPVGGGSDGPSQYYFPTVGMSTVQNDQQAFGGQLTKVNRDILTPHPALSGPGNKVYQK